MQTSKRLKGVGEYYFSKKLREIDEMNKLGKQVINLGIGSPDMPPHPDVINVLQTESLKSNQHGYQNYKGSPVFRKAISTFYKTWYNVDLNPDTEILPLIGSKEGIMHICMTYLNEGDEVLIPNPGYPTYKSAVQLAGGTCVAYDLKEENNWEPDFEELEKKDLMKVRLMWVNYTHMPTGKLPTMELFEKIIAFGRKHNILICHDNPYSFILNNKPMSLLSVKGAKEIAVELNSLSKSGNMAGWRVGWLAGDKEIITEVLQFKSNMDSGMFLPVQLAASKALELGKDWYDSLNTMYAQRRDIVYKILRALDCTYDSKQAGLFIWAKIPSDYEDGFELSDKILYDKKVFITPGGIFGSNGNNFIRVSLCQKTDVLKKALERITDR
ncbi:MAG: aminotransferase class I/II-fold pyridoxal phosphate-dependent enzyme [Chitinophagaceae bacterium]